MLLVLFAIGLWAGSVTRRAAAEPTDLDAGSEPGPTTAAASSLRLDYPPPSARRNLIIAGAATTAGWYGLALGSSYIWPDTVGAKDLRIPVAGPWIAFAHSGCGPVATCHEAIVVVRAIATLIDGIGQASGLGILAEGLFLPTQELGPDRRERPQSTRLDRIEWRPTFDAGKNTVGFGVLGVF